ncbi:MAG: glutaredoxin 3 [Alphaproteobacteria bacterium]|nr:glutaredoxin 3 [Alphaproteobacteria bacterium]
MSKVEIYATQSCPYCHRAKRLLERKGVPFLEIDVSGRPDLRDEMTRRADGRTSVPQIFIDGHHVGGCDDIHDLDARGKLDPMLERIT